MRKISRSIHSQTYMNVHRTVPLLTCLLAFSLYSVETSSSIRFFSHTQLVIGQSLAVGHHQSTRWFSCTSKYLSILIIIYEYEYIICHAISCACMIVPTLSPFMLLCYLITCKISLLQTAEWEERESEWIDVSLNRWHNENRVSSPLQ